MILIEDLSLAHGGTPVLRDINLTIDRGGIIALVGPNGAGKSSLLSLIARLRPLQTGRIVIDGLPVTTTPGRELARRMAILRQDGVFAGRLTVRELVSLGRFPHNQGRSTPQDRARVEEALAQFGVADLAERFLETLSGGQRQRALVAMTFCQGTDYLLLDEPLNNLDMFHARHLMQSLRRMADAEARTAIIVLHDINQAAAYADRIIAMRDGRIVSDGTPGEVLTVDTLAAIFGYRMQVTEAAGRPLVLHHL